MTRCTPDAAVPIGHRRIDAEGGGDQKPNVRTAYEMRERARHPESFCGFLRALEYSQREGGDYGGSRQQGCRHQELAQQRSSHSASTRDHSRQQALAVRLAKSQKDRQPPGIESPHCQDREPPCGEEESGGSGGPEAGGVAPPALGEWRG